MTVTSEAGEYWRLLLPGHYRQVTPPLQLIISNFRISCRAGERSGSVSVYILQSLGSGSVRQDIVLDQVDDLNSGRQLG